MPEPSNARATAGFFGRVWNDIKGFIGGSRNAASRGYFHDINKKKNQALEEADAEVDGRKVFTDADSYGGNDGESDNMDPSYSSTSPTYKRKKKN